MFENSSAIRYAVNNKSYHFGVSLFLVVTTFHSLLLSDMIQALLVKSLCVVRAMACLEMTNL
jgi:hypothetical protein